jgi:hypothetical protein
MIPQSLIGCVSAGKNLSLDLNPKATVVLLGRKHAIPKPQWLGAETCAARVCTLEDRQTMASQPSQ